MMNFKFNNNTKKYEIAYKEDGCDYTAGYLMDGTLFTASEVCKNSEKVYFYHIDLSEVVCIFTINDKSYDKILNMFEDYTDKDYLYFKKKSLFMLD